MKKYLPYIVTIIFIAFCFLSQRKLFSANSEVTYKCIIKPVNGVWGIMDDAAHANSGCIAVTQDAKKLIVSYPRIDTITSNLTQADETLIKYRINVGSSVGFEYSYIYFTEGADPKTIKNGANVFFEVTGLVIAQ